MSVLARLSLANRSLIALVALIVTGFGIFTIPSLKQQLLPSLEFPAASVTAVYPGASPDIVDEQISVPLEDAMRGIDGVSKVTSTARENVATLIVEFDYGTPLDDAVGDLQQAINRLESQLPSSVQTNVFAGSTDDLPAIMLAAGSDGDQEEFAEQLDRIVVPELQAISGVREAAVTGAREQQVVITLDAAKLAAAGVSPTAVGTALRSAGTPIPAGALTEDDQTLTVEVGSALTSVEDLANLYLTPGAASSPSTGPSTGPAAGQGAPAPESPGGTQPPAATPVRLGDVATVEQSLAPATSITRTNGKPSLGISLIMLPDGNAVEISHAVRDKLADLSDQLGGDAELTVSFDQAPAVEKAIEGLTSEGLLGLLFAIIVILVFLLSIRSTLVTAVSIPLSVLIALIALWVDDLSLNMLTLGALTIAVGRVVDDSIVVLENIKRHLGYGEEKQRAIFDGVREVAGAVTASTLTTVAVFIPIALVGGMVGELFAPFAITVTVALLASLLVSLTVVPVLAYWFLKSPKSTGDGDEDAIREQALAKELRSPLQRAYVPIIRFAAKRRLTTVAIGLAVLVGTFALVPLLKTNFIDSAGQTTLSVTQKLPAGTSLDAADTAAAQVEDVLEDLDRVVSYQVTVGSSGGGFASFGGGGGSSARFSITAEDDTDMTALESTLRDRLDALDDAGELTIGAGGFGGAPSGDLIQVVVQAPDQQTLAEATEAVEDTVSGVSGLADVATDQSESSPRIDVTVDRQAAAAAGLTEATIGQFVSQAFQGTTVTQLGLDGSQQDVILRLADGPASLDELRDLPLATATGVMPLSAVAEVSQVDGPVQVSRLDGERTITVSATATDQNVGQITTTLTDALDDVDLPDGASYTIGGVSQDQQEAFADLGLALVVAIAIVFVIMVAAFRSLIQPLILLVAVPFAATGALGLLLITDTALGVPALIGMLMLVGIVVTNAIVLMDLINQYRAAGMSVHDAVVEGGRRRLRPILMTAAATIFALTPMALGVTGEGGFIGQPLAIVVIGGLISSTLLTLVLVPALYAMVEGRKERFKQRREAKRARKNAVPEPAKEPVPA